MVWLVGALAGAISFGFAAFVGSGGGHGSDDAALVVLAPFSLFANPLEENGFLPFLSFGFWGLVVRWSWDARGRGEAIGGVALLGLHVASALPVLSRARVEFLLVPLVPHTLLVVVTLAAGLMRARKLSVPSRELGAGTQ